MSDHTRYTLDLWPDLPATASPEDHLAYALDSIATNPGLRWDVTLPDGTTHDVTDCRTPDDEPAPSVWVATVEWGSEFMDMDSDVFVGRTRATVARLAALATVEFWTVRCASEHEGEREWIDAHPLDADDPDAVQTWLDAYREEFTSCWVTTTTQTIHP